MSTRKTRISTLTKIAFKTMISFLTMIVGNIRAGIEQDRNSRRIRIDVKTVPPRGKEPFVSIRSSSGSKYWSRTTKERNK
jgi:hypothetical protein